MHTDSAKERAARAGAGLVRDGMIVSLGSDTTAALMIRYLANRVAAERISITYFPTSTAT